MKSGENKFMKSLALFQEAIELSNYDFISTVIKKGPFNIVQWHKEIQGLFQHLNFRMKFLARVAL